MSAESWTRVVIESPYAGEVVRNVAFARNVCRYAVERGYAPTASHLLLPQFLNDGNPEERVAGINAGLAQVLSEELPLVWTTVKTQQAPFGARYGRGATASQVTGGSNNMRGWFNLMLQAGATARRKPRRCAARQTTQ